MLPACNHTAPCTMTKNTPNRIGSTMIASTVCEPRSDAPSRRSAVRVVRKRGRLNMVCGLARQLADLGLHERRHRGDDDAGDNKDADDEEDPLNGLQTGVSGGAHQTGAAANVGEEGLGESEHVALLVICGWTTVG